MEIKTIVIPQRLGYIIKNRIYNQFEINSQEKGPFLWGLGVTLNNPQES